MKDGFSSLMRTSFFIIPSAITSPRGISISVPEVFLGVAVTSIISLGLIMSISSFDLSVLAFLWLSSINNTIVLPISLVFSTTDCKFQFCSFSTRNKEFSLLILSQFINIIWFCSIVLSFKSLFVIHSRSCSSSKYLDKLLRLCSCRLFTEIQIKAKVISGFSFTICVKVCETI